MRCESITNRITDRETACLGQTFTRKSGSLWGLKNFLNLQCSKENIVKPLLPVRPVKPLTPVRPVELAPNYALGQWLLLPTNAADKEGGTTLMPHSLRT